MISISDKTVSFIGIPYFPIAVERVVSRKLHGRPTVIVNSISHRSKCLAVSPEARLHGIRTSMQLGDAKRKCRDITVLQPNSALYKRASDAIQRVLDRFSPVSEPLRHGQYYIDLTGCDRLFGSVIDATREIKTAIISELRLATDAGIAGNKLVSRVAAFDANPEGLIRVNSGDEEPFLAPHRIEVLPAADHNLRQILFELNIRLVQQVREIELDTLLAALGPPALFLSRQSRGIDHSPVQPPASQPRVEVIEEFTNDSNDSDQIETWLRKLVIEGVFTLHRKLLAARSLYLKLVYSDGRISEGHQKIRKHTQSGSIWMTEAVKLFRRTLSRRVRVRRIELSFMNLVNDSCQAEMFDRVEIGSENSVLNSNCFMNKGPGSQPGRYDNALNALAAIQAKFGKYALIMGSVN